MKEPILHEDGWSSRHEKAACILEVRREGSWDWRFRSEEGQGWIGVVVEERSEDLVCPTHHGKMVQSVVEELLDHVEVSVESREVHHALNQAQNLACNAANDRGSIEASGP